MVLVNAIEDNHLIMMIIMNSILSFFITVPYHIYKSHNIQKSSYFFIPVVFVVAMLVHNILIITNHLSFLGLTTMMFFMVLLFPAFKQKGCGWEKESPEYKIISMGTANFFIALFFSLLAVPAYVLLRERGYFFSIYFGIFLIVYHIPGLWYCKNRLPHEAVLKFQGIGGVTGARLPAAIEVNPKPGEGGGNELADGGFGTASQVKYNQSGLNLLTKRENEVAMEICSGLKYEEIANKLFISLSAVKKHTYNIYRKLGIKNNRELILLKMAERKEVPIQPPAGDSGMSRLGAKEGGGPLC
jgi:DNA-binding CsgD family transcriptional regulator